MVPLVGAVSIPCFASLIDATTGKFVPDEKQAKAAASVLDELLRWTDALKVLRAGRA
jgi:hypothetical protein